MKKTAFFIYLIAINILASDSTAQTTSFTYTGSVQNYTVPTGINSLYIDMAGAQGGDFTTGSAQGGKGGRVTGNLTVTPGQVLYIYVGEHPSASICGSAFTGGTNSGGGGYGGSGAFCGAPGGGSSDIRTVSGNSVAALNSRVFVAGGGGGGAFDCGGDNGGAGGGLVGGTGIQCGIYDAGFEGTPGNQTTGGSAGCSTPFCGTIGSLGAGGDAYSGANGGGGGGGWYGGGGAYRGGASGGSSYTSVTNATHVTNTPGFQNGNGYVTISIAPPAITSVSPAVGIPGTSVTITGENFDAATSNNIVYFGATRAAVTSASTTSLTAIVPIGGTSHPVTVNNVNSTLAGYAPYSFLATFNNSTYVSAIVNFLPKTDFATGTYPNAVTTGDLDGDGKADVVGSNFAGGTIYIRRNTSSTGSISFAGPITLTTDSGPYKLKLGDLDGDGLLDIAVPNRTTGSITLFRNTSTVGNISFATAVTISLTGTGPGSLSISDIDGDGKSDLLTSDQFVNTISVFRNTGSVGSLSFASAVTFATQSTPYHISTGDIDGDGKPDISVAHTGGSNLVSVFRNVSTPGQINLSARADFATNVLPFFTGITDVDGDGNADLVCLNYLGSTLSVFRSTSTVGSISFATRVDFAVGGNPQEYSVGDFDGDGKPDLAVSNNSSALVSVFRNASSVGAINLTRTDFPSATGPAGIAAGDIDCDGKADIITSCQTDNVFSVLRNNPLAPITGGLLICEGSNTTLSDATTNGTWSSSNTAVATIDSTTGVANGIVAGVVNITYTVTGGITTVALTVDTPPDATFSISPNPTLTGLPSTFAPTDATLALYSWSFGDATSSSLTSPSHAYSAITTFTPTLAVTNSNGCSSAATITVTVNGTVGAISGSPVFCIGDPPITLTHPISGGTWTSSSPMAATVGLSTGIVTAIAPGTAIITYHIGAGYVQTLSAIVAHLPAPITGYSSTCEGTTTGLIDVIGGAGTWTSSNTSVATIGTGSGVLTGISPGTTSITFTNISGCYRTRNQTVNATPTAIAAPSSLCTAGTASLSCSPPGGIWASSNSSVATIDTTTGIVTGIAGGTTIISYTLPTGCGTAYSLTVVNPPSAISGATGLCVGTSATLSCASAGSTWSSSNTAVATVASATPTTGLVTGAGVGVATISYTNSSGCSGTTTVTVNAGLSANTGSSTVCVGQTAALNNAASGGTWTSSTTAKATVGYWTGVVSGVSAGTSNITYKVPSGCVSITQMTVNAPPATAISGASNVCVGSIISLSHSVPGGTWSSSNAAIAAVDVNSGAVAGVSIGYVYVTYTLATGCYTTKVVIVRPLPHIITGPASVEVGAYIYLLDATSGGVWSSSNTSVASVIPSMGIVGGVSTGPVTISYTVPSTGCYATYPITVVPLGGKPGRSTQDIQSNACSISPNPASVSLNVTAETDGVLILHTIDGKMIQQYQITAGNTNISLPDNLASGIYICRFNGIDGSTKMVRLFVDK
jgi:uncharacterized protein YjdB